jgi:hypothetical protein
MTKQQAIDFFGSPTALANALGVTKQAVNNWDVIPETRQYQVQVKSGGKLIADGEIKHEAAA